jgi:hypothetical protein
MLLSDIWDILLIGLDARPQTYQLAAEINRPDIAQNVRSNA